MTNRKKTQSRIEHLMKRVKEPLLVTGMHSVRYLSGFTGSYGAVLVTPDGAWFITDRRYEEQAAQQVAGIFSIKYQDQGLGKLLRPLLPACARLSLESEAVTLAQQDALAEALPGVVLTGVPSPVAAMRAVKDRKEVAKIEAALRLTEEVMVFAAASVRPGMPERELAAMMEKYGKTRGAKGPSFDFIVASGSRSSMPHGEASDRIIEKNEAVLFDFGFIMDGYCSDFTRVLYTGRKPPAALMRTWDLVRTAQEIGISEIKAGAPLAAPDEAVRGFFKKNRVLSRYSHSLGHGVGREIHEAPRLSWRSDGMLESGMVVTVEPGLYRTGKFGVRLEDMVLVTGKGARRLTEFPLEIACTG